MGKDKILLHLNISPRQNVTKFSQNPLIHQKSQNDVLPGDVNVFPKSGNYVIGRTRNFSHICQKAIKQKEPLRGVP